MRLCVALFAVVLLASCLNSFSPADGSANAEDLGVPVDLLNADLQGLLNCPQLNDCEQQCTNTACVADCRMRARPDSLVKELMLQSCFNTNCPQRADMGMAICERDQNGMFSSACKQCIANTQQAMSTACAPANAPECKKCYNEAQACLNDT
jgi:hypothetical protein